MPPSFSFFSAALKLSMPLRSFGQAVVADQAGGGELVLVVVEDDRMRIEGHGILLAVDMHRFPGGRREAVSLRPIVFMSSAVISVSVLWLTAERNARGVIGHDVRAFANGGRCLDLGVERHAPVERRRLDLDRVLVLVVEVLDELLHADAVAAAEEVPPDDRFLARSRWTTTPAPRRPKAVLLSAYASRVSLPSVSVFASCERLGAPGRSGMRCIFRRQSDASPLPRCERLVSER